MIFSGHIYDYCPPENIAISHADLKYSNGRIVFKRTAEDDQLTDSVVEKYEQECCFDKGKLDLSRYFKLRNRKLRKDFPKRKR